MLRVLARCLVGATLVAMFVVVVDAAQAADPGRNGSEPCGSSAASEGLGGEPPGRGSAPDRTRHGGAVVDGRRGSRLPARLPGHHLP